MAQLAPMMQLRPRFEDKCGHPLAGGNVFAFEAGTSDPKATYADAEGTIPNTHPIKLDYRGEADIFLLSGRYRFVVYSCTGVKIYDVDDVGEWLGTLTADRVIDGDKTQHQINAEQAIINTDLAEDITNETERAELAEANLNTIVDAEITRATGAEAALDAKITIETSRATAAEMAIDAKVNANGVGNRAYKTYAEMDADKANISAKSKVTVTNDPTASNNGDWNWDGAAFTKSAYDPISQAAADATNKANAAESNARLYTNAKVDLSQSISQYLVNKSPDTTLPKFGDVTTGGTASPVALGTYILITPASVATTIKRFSIVSNVASGDVEIRKYSKSGTTFTLLSSIATVHVNKIGLNEFSVNDFLPFTVNVGEYLAATVKTAGAMVYIGSSANDIYYSNSSTGTGPITGTTGKANLKFAFFDTNGVERAQTFIDYLERVSNESEINFDNILVDYAGNLGLSTTPSAKSGVNAGVGHYCTGAASTGFGKVATLEVYSAVTGFAQVGVYSKSGQVFTRKRYKDVTLAVGLNSIPIDLALSVGDYVGLRTTVAGQIEYEANTSGHDGVYVSVAGSTPDQFTASTATPNPTYAYQFRFILALERLSSDVIAKPWASLKYVSFGDSITWYNGRPFVPQHIEAGQIAKGYQSYIVDSLGCTLDNRGESGWIMQNIYADRILPYNFSDVYAVSITSGYNDHKHPTEMIGTVQSIGSTFDVSTYAGAMQASVEHVIASNAKTKIFLIVPIRGWYSATVAANFRDEVKNETLLSIKYVDVVKQIGALYGVQVIDFYNEVGFNYLNRYTFLGDDPAQIPDYLAHPTQLGFKRMGEVALSVMKNF